MAAQDPIKDQFKKFEKIIEQLQRNVAVLSNRVRKLEQDNVKLRGVIHQQKNDIAQLSRKQ